MSPRSKDTDDTVKTAADVPSDPHVVESLVESEKAVAPLTASELCAHVVELCTLFASIDSHNVTDREIAERLPAARARVSEIRTLVETHLPPAPTASAMATGG